jgi:hypothetical protein
VHALVRLEDQRGVLPMYDLVQDESADPGVRHVAAEALVTLGLLRRERRGPSPVFLWLLGMLLVVGSVAAADSLGAWAILVFVAGAGALGVYAFRQLGQRRGLDDVYVGPYGERLRLSGGSAEGAWLGGFGDAAAGAGDGGGDGGGGGSG